MSFKNYYHDFKPFKEIQSKNHSKSADGKTEEYVVECIIPINGVPFCKHSRLSR
jgi:hypothetical protein